MPTVHETIPDALRPEVDAALGWWNAQEGESFEVTGILDPDEASARDGARELRLVLCGGDRCEQRSFRVASRGDGFDVELLEAAAPASGAPAPELDPPPGPRRSWLDGVQSRHAFVVLVFYRGYW